MEMYHPMLFQCWASVEDGGPTLKQHCVTPSHYAYALVINICKKTHKKIIS